MTPQQVGLATNNELRSLSFIYFFKFKVEEVPNTVLAEALGLLERDTLVIIYKNLWNDMRSFL